MNEDELRKKFEAEVGKQPSPEEMVKLMGGGWRTNSPVDLDKESKELEQSIKTVQTILSGEPLLKKAFILGKALGLTIADIAEINVASAAGSIKGTMEMLTAGAAEGTNKKMGGDDA